MQDEGDLWCFGRVRKEWKDFYSFYIDGIRRSLSVRLGREIEVVLEKVISYCSRWDSIPISVVPHSLSQYENFLLVFGTNKETTLI